MIWKCSFPTGGTMYNTTRRSPIASPGKLPKVNPGNQDLNEIEFQINNSLAATSSGSAQRFKRKYTGNAIYVHELKLWHIWNGKYWQPDTIGQLRQMVRNLAPDALLDLQSAPTDAERKIYFKEYTRLLDTRSIDHILKEAASLTGIATSAAQLDKATNYFNVQNGTLVFNDSGFQFTRHNPEHRLTKISNFSYDKDAIAPEYQNFEKLIFQNNDGLICFNRQYIASAISGHQEDSICFIIGEKANNGKSTYCENYFYLFGHYSQKVRCNTLANRNENISQARPDLLKLRGAKLVLFEEIPQGFKINDALLKDITGGDSITARNLYSGSEITYKPQFKALLYGNHKPGINGNDEGIKRRVKYIPFEYKFSKTECDNNPKPKVLKQFKDESAGILNLLLHEYQQSRENGFTQPREVSNATNEYLEDNDIYKTFIQDCYTPLPGSTIPFNDAYNDFIIYTNNRNDLNNNTISKKAFSAKLRNAGVNIEQRAARATFLIGYFRDQSETFPARE